MRILFVENHRVFATIAIAEFLADHVVTIAPSIATAISLLDQQTFDTALVDYDLDDGKGTEVVRHLKRHAPQTRIIAVSSHDRGNTALLQAGANAACPKPNFHNITKLLNQLG